VAKYEIEIPDGLVPGLNKLVARYNADAGTDMSVADWLRMHVTELALVDELQAERQRLTAQAQRDVEVGLQALRDRIAAEGVSA
jgi:hypothetical protein